MQGEVPVILRVRGAAYAKRHASDDDHDDDDDDDDDDGVGISANTTRDIETTRWMPREATFRVAILITTSTITTSIIRC